MLLKNDCNILKGLRDDSVVQSGNCSFRGQEFGFPDPFHDVLQPPVTPDLGSFMVWLLQAPTCSRYTHR